MCRIILKAMRYLKLYLLVFSFSLISCQSQQATLLNSDIVLDFDSSLEMKREYFSSYFDGGGIIALESTPNALLGRIEKLCVSQEYFFILDNSGVFVFRKDGKFLRSISRCGNGPGEYNRLSDINVDDKNKEVYLLDPVKRNVLVYNFDNIHQRTIPLPNKGFCSRLAYYDGSLYFSLIGSRGLDKNWLLCKMELNNNNKVTYHLEADEYNKGWYGLYYADQPTFMPSSSGSPLLFQIFNDGIIKIDTDSPKPYVSILSKFLPTESFVAELNTDNFNDKISNSDYIYSIFDFVENNRFLSFSFHQKNTTKTFFYNKETTDSYIAKSFFNDVLYTDDEASYIISKFDAADKERVYCIDGKSMYAKELLQENLERGKINQSMVGIENLKNFLADEEANPIIVYYNLRK